MNKLDLYGWAKRSFPTTVAIVLLVYVLRQNEALASERKDVLGRQAEILTKLTQAIEAQTAAFRELAAAEKDHADAVKFTWPALRFPRRIPVPDGGPP